MVSTVLLTARSACAAWGILEIWRHASLDKNLKITVIAQQPAKTILANHHIPVLAVDLPPALDKNDSHAEKILAYTKKILSQLSPNVALVGLSTPGEGGIDEAVLALAQCPTFMLQDFWGDSNLFFGKHPDCYLVADQEAALATERRHNKKSLILGSPRHAKYTELDFDLLSKLTLKRLGLKNNAIVHGFFCQPLFFPGYFKTIRIWAEAVRDEVRHEKIIYRPHPASSRQQILLIKNIFSECDLDFITLEDNTVESIIAACTSISSAMSNSNIDAVFINHFAIQSMASPIYLLYDQEVVRFLDSFQSADTIPTVKQGVALLVREQGQLALVLEQSMKQQIRQQLWFNARKLPDPVEAVHKAKSLLLNPDQFLP